MLDPDGLNVWSDQRLVGYLWRNTQGQIGFRYEEDWLTQGGFAISHTLPLRHGDITPEAGLAHRFFANLLPEGGVRDQIVRDLKISNTDFDLLRAIGGECAGALSVLQAEYQPSTEYEYYKVSDEDLANLVARRGQVYTWSANERPRLSLAGAQDKCPLLVRNGAYWLPKNESPSSHILKFELSDYRHLPAYETFTTLLAGAIGLPVVDIQLRSIADTHYALIERYDRRSNKHKQIVRLHQEDFCQALGLGHERKYQADGGPSFADCYRLVQDVSSDPANDLQYLLRWQIFNVLAGNSDGHTKNLSLLYEGNGETRLAPFYDLVCTRAIERIDYHLAFSVGDERNPGVVSRKHWETLAQHCGVRPRFLQGQVQDVAAQLLEQLQPTRETFERLYGDYAALQRIEQIVMKQCRRTIEESL
ncbi:type II toxin-antitoxin system HipA family toxin [Mangrovimicrobium sediminis]|uniref:Type II toxin-antitoxin system HipA family toxin n=1 Tax=Mangrovimicrobium sediminis TaxID=2562682 RepID=A0A4Z0LYD1_9GAMM|nr:type II toxin-antitoxin system HipA family toxin [Haliea sp. SAOS-164]TGD72148.1 type II toxin-antitoxin system HipA family toxin [Haliea sp. SAOS-164]